MAAQASGAPEAAGKPDRTAEKPFGAKDKPKPKHKVPKKPTAAAGAPKPKKKLNKKAKLRKLKDAMAGKARPKNSES
jgi:hypothetical protein